MKESDPEDFSEPRLRVRRRPDAKEWMALLTPGWRPAPLTVEDARAFMARS